MIVLDNFSKMNTSIIIDGENYKVVAKENRNQIENGEGGFSENGDLLGIYMENGKMYFRYNKMSYETTPSELLCKYQIQEDGMRNFIVSIRNAVVCDITYKPYISPFALTFGDDDEEFDYLLCLSRLLVDVNAIESFIESLK